MEFDGNGTLKGKQGRIGLGSRANFIILSLSLFMECMNQFINIHPSVDANKLTYKY